MIMQNNVFYQKHVQGEVSDPKMYHFGALKMTRMYGDTVYPGVSNTYGPCSGGAGIRYYKGVKIGSNLWIGTYRHVHRIEGHVQDGVKIGSKGIQNGPHFGAQILGVHGLMLFLGIFAHSG